MIAENGISTHQHIAYVLAPHSYDPGFLLCGESRRKLRYVYEMVRKRRGFDVDDGGVDHCGYDVSMEVERVWKKVARKLPRTNYHQNPEESREEA